MTAQQGDLVRLSVSGPDVDDTRQFLDALIVEIAPVAVPIDDDASERQHFDLFTLAMDFIVAASAGLSAEGIRHLITARWRAFRRSRSRPTAIGASALETIPGEPSGTGPTGSSDEVLAGEAMAPEVTIKVFAEGVVEIQVRIR